MTIRNHWRKTCDTCNAVKSYSTRYDVYYCRPCDVWLEPKCSTPSRCEFCQGRPERPSLCNDINKEGVKH